nr:hypothetical protein LSAT_4X28141 [Ipomoea trifida]GMD35047.1 hypothetical protein LSAT_4X28141 [Ipomoea batatas]
MSSGNLCLGLIVLLILLPGSQPRPLQHSQHEKRLTAPFRALFQREKAAEGGDDRNGSLYTLMRNSPGGPDPIHH